MGFKRSMVSVPGQLPSPSRAGDGMLAHLLPAVGTATATLTNSQISGGSIVHATTLGAAATYTLPTAAILAEMLGSMDIGDSYSFMVTNAQAAAHKVVIAVAAGITAVGANNSLSVVPESTRVFTLVRTGAATFNLI